MKKIIISAFMATHLFAFVDVNPSCCKQEIIEQTNNMSVENQMQISHFYQNHAHNLMWDERDLNDFLHATRDSMVNYLFFDYHQDEIEALMSQVDGDDSFEKRQLLAQIDILATDGFLSLARDISESLIDYDKFYTLLQEQEAHLVWEKSSKPKNYTSDLAIALKSDMVEALINRYLPIGDEYRELVRVYHRYSDISFPKVDYGPLMKVGDYGYRASQLKEFLVATGDMKPQSKEYVEFPTYDENLANALKRFQKRHYLKESGELDRVTVLYTRKSVEKKRELLKLNIERHKLFSKIYDKEYILINIPEFSLKYFDHGSLIDDIFIVVGREDRPTPIFHDYLEYIVLNPSWVVPQNLMRKDYIPKLVENPYAMEEEHIHIHKTPSRYSPEINPELVNWEKYLQEGVHIPYYFMQYPGEDNVLGQMKFIFPNKYNVYLHDTNSKGLTTLKYRLYSSGCMRLSRPFDLLHILAKHTKYSDDALVSMIESGKSVNVPLRKKIPIYIRYFTVFMNGGYAPSFRKDFYGLDALQLGSMRK